MKEKNVFFDKETKVDLKKISTDAPDSVKKKKEEILAKTEANIKKISEYQEKLYADGKEGLIFVLQARDAAGKDSTIKHLMTGINPQGVMVYSFKTPSKEEAAHDFLWRFNKCLPERGKIAIFNRSYYEDVLVVRVKHLENTYAIPARCVTGDYFEKRYKHINNYEEELFDNGYQIIKVFLNVSKDEQKKRFLERIDKPEKNWKFSFGDLDDRALWDEYTDCFEKMVEKTSTKDAPWYVIPADCKWYARYLISEIFVERLKEMNPKYPELPESEKAKFPEVRKILGEVEKPAEKEDKTEDKKSAKKETGKADKKAAEKSEIKENKKSDKKTAEKPVKKTAEKK